MALLSPLADLLYCHNLTLDIDSHQPHDACAEVEFDRLRERHSLLLVCGSGSVGGKLSRGVLFGPSPPLRREENHMSTGQRRLDIEEIGGVTVAKFVDKKILDETNIQNIGNQLFALVDEDGRKKIVLDFSIVEYLSSAALGKLITMDKKVKAAKARLRLCCIRPEIYEVFEITRLNKIFDIKSTQEDALDGM